MKSIKFLLLLTLFVVLGISSCDVIEAPYTKNSEGTISDTNRPNILLEEFTAHTCVHCPKGTKTAKALEEQYAEKVFVVSIHCGSMARPQGNYTYDYRTSIGEELNTVYDGEASMPSALINRQSQIPIVYSKWANEITAFWSKNKTRQLNIVLSAECDIDTKVITANVKLNYFVPQSTQNKVCVWILEDSLVSRQKNYEEPYEIPDYCHDDVLRASFNGTWGEVVSSSTIPAGFEFNKNYTYEIPTGKDWKLNHLRVIAFVYDDNGVKQVIATEVMTAAVNDAISN